MKQELDKKFVDGRSTMMTKADVTKLKEITDSLKHYAKYEDFKLLETKESTYSEGRVEGRVNLTNCSEGYYEFDLVGIEAVKKGKGEKEYVESLIFKGSKGQYLIESVSDKSGNPLEFKLTKIKNLAAALGIKTKDVAIPTILVEILKLSEQKRKLTAKVTVQKKNPKYKNASLFVRLEDDSEHYKPLVEEFSNPKKTEDREDEDAVYTNDIDFDD